MAMTEKNNLFRVSNRVGAYRYTRNSDAEALNIEFIKVLHNFLDLVHDIDFLHTRSFGINITKDKRIVALQ